jgi:beta-glucosidase
LNKKRKILVTGPTANSMKYLNGGWSYNRQGENSDTHAADKSTIPEALQNKLGKEKCSTRQVVILLDFDDAEIEKAVEMAKKCFENNCV